MQATAPSKCDTIITSCDVLIAGVGFVVSLFRFFIALFGASDVCKNWISMLIYWVPAIVFGWYFIPRAKEFWSKLTDGGHQDLSFYLPDVNNHPQGVEMAPSDAPSREVHLDEFDLEDDEPPTRDLEQGNASNDDDEESEEQSEEAREEERRKSIETIVLVVGSLLLVAFLLPVHLAPSIPVTMIAMLFVMGLWAFVYIWVKEIFMMGKINSNTLWLCFFSISLLVLVGGLGVTLVPPCADHLVGFPNQRFINKIEMVPWNCKDPYFTTNSTRIAVENHSEVGWALVGRLPNRIGDVETVQARMHCCGHPPAKVLPISLYTFTDPNTANGTSLDPIIPSKSGQYQPCAVAPTFSRFDFWNVYFVLLICGWIGVLMSAMFSRTITWFRSRGMCLCLGCSCCRRAYMPLNMSPDSAS